MHIRELEAPEYNEYGWYCNNGGRLSTETYQSVLTVPQKYIFPPNTLAQATRMLRLIPNTALDRKRRYIHHEAIQRGYGQLRGPLSGECTSWSDEKIFAEVLLVHHYVAAHKEFKKQFPQFNTKVQM